MNLEKIKTEKIRGQGRTNTRTKGYKTSISGCRSGEIDPEMPLFSIGTAAAMLEVHPRTLRIYEQEGLIRPFRKAGRRYFSLNDIQWVKCLRHMIHDQGISIAGIKRLLELSPCWQIASCSKEKKRTCGAYGFAPAH